MKYLKLFEEFDDEYYEAKEKFQIIYDEWFKKYREYVNSSEEEQSTQLGKLIDTEEQNLLDYREAFDKTWKEHKLRLEEWKKNNPAPIFQKDVEIEQESERIEQALKEIIRRLNLNKTGSWGSGQNPFDDDLGNYNIKNKTLLAVKPHYMEDDGEHDEELLDGIKLELIMVHPDHRNQGLASKRLQEFLDITDELKVKVFLSIAPQDESTSEERLIQFYKKFGFHLIDEWSEKSFVREPINP